MSFNPLNPVLTVFRINNKRSVHSFDPDTDTSRVFDVVSGATIFFINAEHVVFNDSGEILGSFHTNMDGDWYYAVGEKAHNAPLTMTIASDDLVETQSFVFGCFLKVRG